MGVPLGLSNAGEGYQASLTTLAGSHQSSTSIEPSILRFHACNISKATGSHECLFAEKRKAGSLRHEQTENEVNSVPVGRRQKTAVFDVVFGVVPTQRRILTSPNSISVAQPEEPLLYPEQRVSHERRPEQRGRDLTP